MPHPFDLQHLNVTGLDRENLAKIVCELPSGLENGNEDEDEKIELRVAALVVILVASTAFTVLPLFLKKRSRDGVARRFYDAFKYIGAGVIIGTAFCHLLDSAFKEIGPQSCVGMTGNWAGYSWPPAIMLASLMWLFLLEFGVGYCVESTRCVSQSPSAAELLAAQPKTSGAALLPQTNQQSSQDSLQKEEGRGEEVRRDNTPTTSFTQKFTTILILESGIIFHSIIIGLNLGTTSSEELTSLWIVLSFHQTFEGLGLGVRLAEIEFPKKKEWIKWALCVLYGLTTPVAIAAGLGLRRSYDAGSFEANVVSGVLDSISAGILVYTGLVEMLAKDFLFNSEMKTKGKREVGVLVFYVLLGAGLMALLAKWA